MVPRFKNLCETCTIPPGTRERFLPLGHPSLAGLRALGVRMGGVSLIGPGYRMVRFRPTFHALLYVLEGEAHFGNARAQAWAGPGERLLFPAGEFQAYAPKTPAWRMAWFHLDAARAHRGLGKAFLRTRDPGACRAVERVMAGLLDEVDLRRDRDLVALWSGLLLKTLRRDLFDDDAGFAGPAPEAARLDEVWGLVSSQLESDWSLKRMASHTVWTRAHFARLCASRYGEPPMKRLARLRMEHAEGLLAATALPVGEISQRSGYSDAFAFSTAFRRHAGLPPAVWRGRRKGKRDPLVPSASPTPDGRGRPPSPPRVGGN
ncbi:MAG: AraC family transcriptional regulator [Spirochaetes bacterium]|nr:AraC family transcriptional regulator [Spirochaetota bacterium]